MGINTQESLAGARIKRGTQTVVRARVVRAVSGERRAESVRLEIAAGQRPPRGRRPLT